MSPEDFLQIADVLPEAVLLVTAEGEIVAANRGCARLGISARDLRDLRGLRLQEVSATSPQELHDYLRACSRSRQPLIGSLRLKGSEASRWQCVGSVLEPRTGDRPARILLRLVPRESALQQFAALNQKIEDLSNEIRRRRQVEEDLRDEQERLRITLDSIGDAVIATDSHGRVQMLNPIAESLTGWTSSEARDLPLEQVFRIENEYTRDPVENPVAKVLSTGTIVGLANHTVLIARDGTERPIDDSGAPIRDTDGRIGGVVLVFRDISERRLSEQALIESEERFRQLAESVEDVFYVTDARQPAILYISPGYERVWGRSSESLYEDPRSFLEAIHPDDRASMETCLAQQGQGDSTACEYRIIRPDGEVRWIWDRSFPVRDEGGRVVRIAGVAEDITERKRAEQSLHFLSEASSALSSLVDYRSTLQRVAGLAIPGFADWCAVDVADESGTLQRLAITHSVPGKLEAILEINRRYPQAPETPHGSIRVFRTGKPELVPDVADSLLQEVARDEEHLRLLRGIRLHSYLCVPMLVRERTVGVLTFASDVSGRRYDPQDLAFAEELARRAAVAIENARLYQAVRDADRRKDEFLAMLAHELRNPLAPIRSGLDLIRLREGDDEVLGIMQRQVEHLVRLVDDLLDVSRIMRGKIELRKEPIELGQIVSRAVETVRPMIDSRGHVLQQTLPDQPVWLKADPVRLAQAVANLLHNAAKYTEAGGRIWVACERRGHEVAVEVGDTGAGMDAELLARAFDLFAQGARSIDRSLGGLGIGLTVVRSLVEMHGGSVQAFSKGPHKGSVFTIRLPVLAGHNGNPVQPSVPQRTPGRRILIVEDNYSAAQILALLLKELGPHEIRTAHSGEKAIQDAVGFLPEVVLLDIGLPKMDGYEVARRLRQIPETAGALIVAITGYGTEEDRRSTTRAGFDEHLVKPPALERLQSILLHPKLQNAPG